MDDDPSFVARLKSGSPLAFAMLVEQFEGPLFRFFYCSHGDHHRAEDETAETFSQLVASFRTMHEDCRHLRAYVFATARHVQVRRYRQPNKSYSPLSHDLPIADRRPAPDIVASDREQLKRLLDAIRQLEPPLPSVLLLRFVEGFSLDEIADLLDLPPGTVKSHIHRSRSRLKQLFAESECRT